MCAPINKPGFGSGDNIDFNNLRVGQTTRYVSFTIANDTVKTYGKDTAVVQITGTYGSGFVFSANFSPGSISFTKSSPSLQYGIIIKNDSCNATLLSGNNIYLNQLIPSQNFPFSFVDEGSVAYSRLSPSFCNWIINQSLNKVSFDGNATDCKISNFYFDTVKIVVNNLMPLSNGIGYLWVFTKNTGYLSTMSYAAYSTSSTSASGWEFLP